MAKSELFAVTGHPVFRSLSPVIFNRAFAADSFPGVYLKAAAESAEEALGLFRSLGLKGMNVTAPLKTRVRELVDDVDAAAARIGAVNTVTRAGAGLKGWNTDHLGAVGALRANGVPVSGRTFVVLGAGGAGRAAAYGLVNEGASVTIVNRDYGKASRAAAAFGCRAGRADRLESLLRTADGFVSAVTAPAQPVPADWLRPGTAVIDARYPASPLAAHAAKRGCPVVGGEDWLLHQAIPAYRIFTGVRAPEKAMRDALAGERPVPAPKGRRAVALVGFMGSGKSEVGVRLALHLGFRSVDLDAAVESREGLPVSEIFARHGEGRFRRAEKAALAGLVPVEGTVVACGGGAVLDADNRAFLRANFTVVWLTASLETSLERFAPGTRPLLEGGDRRRTARGLLASRLPFYAAASDLVISGEAPAPETAERIHDEIGESLRD